MPRRSTTSAAGRSTRSSSSRWARRTCSLTASTPYRHA